MECSLNLFQILKRRPKIKTCYQINDNRDLIFTSRQNSTTNFEPKKIQLVKKNGTQQKYEIDLSVYKVKRQNSQRRKNKAILIFTHYNQMHKL